MTSNSAVTSAVAPTINKVYIDQEEYFTAITKATNYLISKVAEVGENILLLGVARGGTIPTTLIDYKISSLFKERSLFAVSSRFVSINFYDGESSLANESFRSVLETIPRETKYSRVYVIDDLLDSGRTLSLLHTFLDSSKLCAFNKTSVEYITLFKKDSEEVLTNFKNLLSSSTSKTSSYSYYCASEKRFPLDSWIEFWYD